MCSLSNILELQIVLPLLLYLLHYYYPYYYYSFLKLLLLLVVVVEFRTFAAEKGFCL